MDGTKPLLIFRDGATRSNEVAVTKPENIQAPDAWVLWEPGEDSVAEHYLLVVPGSFDEKGNPVNGKVEYSPPPPPEVVPDKRQEMTVTIADIATNPKVSRDEFIDALRLTYAQGQDTAKRDQQWAEVKERIEAAKQAEGAIEAEPIK